MIFRASSLLLPLAAALALATPVAASAQSSASRSDQAEAREQLMAGKGKSLREIEARVVPQMRGMQYVGFRYFKDEQVYRLRFVRGDRVVDVDVDAKTGNIIRQSE